MPKIRVLYVDDEPDLLVICKLYLEMNSEFEVDTAERGSTALEILKNTTYDAIISDYQMPVMDGIGLLKEVRSRFGKIPFILFTGRGREEVVVEALNNGADYYLQKGGDPTAQFTELAHKVRLAVNQRRALQALSESESRFRDLTENSLDTIMLFDRDLRHLYVNPNVEAQTGIPADKFIGKTHAEMGFPKDLVELWDRTLKRVFESGKKDRVEFRIPSGIWIDWLLVPIHAPDGSVMQVVTSARDITDRKKAEEQIQLAEFSLEHSGLTTFWLDEGAHIVRANQAACDALGYTKDEFTHIRVFDFDPLYQEEAWTHIWNRIAQEKYVVIESIHKRKDGTKFPVEIASTFFEYEGKHLIHSFARDISERKRAEDAVRESEAKYRTLFEKSKEPMLIIDQGKFIDCNDATLALVGVRTKEEFLKLDPAKISPPQQPDGRESAEKANEMIETALREGSHQFEWLHRRMNGDLFWAEISLTAIPLGDRKIIHTIWRDITSRKTAEEELKAAYAQITASEEELRSQLDEITEAQKEKAQTEQNFQILVDNIPDAIYIATSDYRFVYLNTAALRLFGASSEEQLLGTNTLARIHPPLHKTIRERVSVLTEDVHFVDLLEEIYLKLDGTPVDVEVAAIPFLYHGEHAVLVCAHDISNKKKAQEEILFKNLIMSTQQETSPDAILIVDDNGNILSYNKNFLDLWSVPPDLVATHLDDPLLKYVLPKIAEPDAFLSRVRYLYEHKEEKSFEEILLTDGRILERFSAPMLGQDKKTYGRVWYFRDITKRKRTEAEIHEAYDRITASEEELRENYNELAKSERRIRESETRLAEIINFTPDATFAIDTNGRVIAWNKAIEDITGVPAAEMLGKGDYEYALPFYGQRRPLLIDLINAPDADLKQYYTDIQRGNNTVTAETSLVRLRGESRILSAKASRLFDEHGDITGAIESMRDITPLRHAENALKEREAFFRALFDQASQLAGVLDTEGNLIRVNNTALSLIDQDMSAVLNQPFWETPWWAHDAAQKERVRDAVVRARNGETVQFEATHFDQEGLLHSIDFSLKPILDENGRVFALLPEGRDMTTQKQAEMSLRESEERFRLLVKNSSDIIQIMDQNGVPTYISDQLFPTLGYYPAERIGISSFSDIHPDDSSIVIRTLEEIIRDPGLTKKVEYRYRHKDGHWVYFEAIGCNRLDDPAVHGIFLNIRDISERKRAEAALQENERYYRAIFDTALYGIAHTGPDLRFIRVNDTFCSMMEYPRDELIGKMGIADITHPDDLAESRGQMAKLMHREQDRFMVEKRYITRSGRLLHAMVFVVAVFDADGRYSGASASIMDITRLKNADRELQQSRDQFRAFIDHSYDAVFIHDTEGRILDVNTTMLEIYDVARDEALTYSIADYTGPVSSMDEAHEHWKQVLAGNDQLFPWQARRPKDGSLFDAEVFLTRIETGQSPLILGNVRDVSEQKKALDALRLAEFSIEHTGVPTFWFDRTSRIVRVNEASCLALGYSRDELLGMYVRDVDPNFPSEGEWDRSWNQAKELGEYKVSESLHRRKDGTTFPVEIVTSFFTYGDQEYLFSFVRDISERIQADEMIKESEERYRSVVNDQTDLIARFTPDGVITFVNEAYRSYFTVNLNLSEVTGKTIREIMQVQNYDQIDQFLRSLTPGSPVKEMEREFTGSHGGRYWQSWTVRALFDTRGTVTEFQVVGRDITQRKLAELALKQSEERFRSIADTLPGVLYQFYARKNGEMGLYYVSERADDFFGTGADPETFFRLFTAHVAPECRAEFLASIERVVRERLPWDYRGRFIHDDGSEMFFHGLSEPVESGDELVFYGVLLDITAEERAGRALAASEARYHSLFSNAADAIFIMDGERILDCNPAALRLFQCTKDQILGKTPYDLSPETQPQGRQSREMARERIVAASAGTPQLFPWVHMTANGGTFPADVTLSCFDQAGASGLIAIIRDTSERTLALASLQQSEERYRSLVETTGTGYVILDSTGKVVTANTEYLRLTGRTSLSDIEGRSVTEWTAPHDLERNAQEVEACFRTGHVRNLEIDYLKPEGSVQPVEINASVIGTGPEQVILTLCRDISERRAVESALREEQQFTRLLLDTSPAFFVAIGADGRTLAMNRALMEALEYTEQEIRGADYLGTFVPPEDRQALAQVFHKIVYDNKETVNQNHILSKSGNVFLVEWHGRPVKHKGKERDFFVGVGIDISKRMDAEKALQQANNKLNLLNTITRHDMLNQLVALKGFLDLMRAKAADPASIDYFERCNRITENLERQINFTRDYQDMGVKAPVWQDIKELVQKNAAALPLGNVQVIAEFSGIDVYADPLFEKVFYNLIDNAMRYAGAHLTSIRFSCSETPQGCLLIRCEDDGQGIALQDKKNLFMRGFGRNTGLGLFLTREILGLTGITIGESGEPGKGARFDILVPPGAFRWNDPS